jgi:hypothetical protein
MKETIDESAISPVAIIGGGTRITPTMIGIMTPGTGVSASRFNEVIGSRTARDIPVHSLLKESDLKWK